ncbi:MAG: hypothetical protein ACLSWR_08900 [Ruthenibacterium sp.]
MKKSVVLRIVSFMMVCFTLAFFTACGGASGAAEQLSEEEDLEKNETGVTVNGSVISWANMKVDNPNLQLSDEQLQVLQYFDNDYFSVGEYENLQRYPQIYRNAQISFHGIITKILQMDDETYECLFWMNGYPDETTGAFNPDFVDTNKLLVIRGKQPQNARVTVGDWIECNGRYLDVESFTIDGESAYYPVVSVNYTVPFGFTGVETRFDLSTIKSVAQAVFGEDIKIKEPVCGEDFELDALHPAQYFFYLVTPDNQSNSNFSQFEFSRMNGSIRDAKSTSDVERIFNVAADFEHYIVSVYDRNLHLMYLEYYDRDFQKLWSREFENVDSIPYDYTSQEIALVADNDLYIIDTQTGQDKMAPVLVGEKVSVNIMEDGIVLIGTGNKDNVMKTDRQGNVIWKASADMEVTSCNRLQIIDGNIIAELMETEMVPVYGGEAEMIRRSDMVAIDSEGTIISQFTDWQSE